MNPIDLKRTIFVLTLILLLGFQLPIYGQQICSGNLGENIFERGDFGTGITNVIIEDPMIAPGYEYVRTVPNDGQYTITKNTAGLSGLWPSWLRIRDRSVDQDGYMMVVNASFEPGVFYTEIVEGLCDNTLYEFSADIINMIAIGWEDHIEPNVDFLLDGEVVYSTGSIPQDENWYKYGFTFFTDPGQTSVELTLRNNAPGGIGNDLALDNISFRPCGPSSFIGIDRDTTIFLCIDDDAVRITADPENSDDFVFIWQSSFDGINWTDLPDSTNFSIWHDSFDPGSYFYRYLSATNESNLSNEKCRIISDMIQIEVLPRTFEFTDTFCAGSSYPFDGERLTEGGSYTGNFVSSFGCDSLVFLTLVEVPDIPISFDVDVTNPSCIGDQDGSITLFNIQGGYESYTIETTLDDMVVGDVNMLSADSYQIKVSDRFGCEAISLVDVNSPPIFEVDLGNDQMVDFGTTINLNPLLSYPAAQFNWSANGLLSCDNCQQVEFTPFTSGFVSIQAVDANGCEAVDSVFIEVEPFNEPILPNIFSPNGDGVNDYIQLYFKGSSILAIQSLQIFDRYGNLVKSEENINATSGMELWDGFFNDARVTQGVYLISLRYELVSGQIIEFSQSITVVY